MPDIFAPSPKQVASAPCGAPPPPASKPLVRLSGAWENPGFADLRRHADAANRVSIQQNRLLRSLGLVVLLHAADAAASLMSYAWIAVVAQLAAIFLWLLVAFNLLVYATEYWSFRSLAKILAAEPAPVYQRVDINNSLRPSLTPIKQVTVNKQAVPSPASLAEFNPMAFRQATPIRTRDQVGTLMRTLGSGLDSESFTPPVIDSSALVYRQYTQARVISPPQFAISHIQKLFPNCEMVAPTEAFQLLRLHNHVHELSEMIRSWLVRKVVKPLHQRIIDNDRELQSHNLGHLISSTVYQVSTAPAPAPQPSALFTSSFGRSFGTTQSIVTPPTTLGDLFTRFSHLAPVRERIVIERFLSISPERQYILERIKQLCQGGILSAFQWDAGASSWGQDKKWTQELPTDSELIMHLFTTFMDLAMPGADISPIDAREFSSRHFCIQDHRPELRSRLVIHCLATKPPHYCLVKEKHVLEMLPGRNNIFLTLGAFIVSVFRTNSGMLGLLNVRASTVDLGEFERL